MKKMAAFALSAIMAVSMLAACGGGDSEETTTVTTTEATTTEAATEATTEATTEAEVTEDTDFEDDFEEPELTGLALVADKVFSYNGGQWPMMMQIEDPELISEFFLINTADYEDVYVSQCMINASTAELIIIKAGEGKLEDAKAALEARKKKLIEQDAFYPESVEIAEASIIDTTGNYAYFIAWMNPGDYVEVLESALAE